MPGDAILTPVRFHAIMLVRDEADVLAEALEGILGWADSLWVLDNGSVDGSWEIVQEAARADPRVRPWGRVCALYSDALRAAVFHDARASFGHGDWIARVDADEFFHTPPQEFVRERIGRSESFVCGLLHEFVLLKREAAAIGRGEEDLSRPIADRRRWWTPNHFPEPRLFRYRRSMKWPVTRGHPWLAGVMARERIQIRHYRWRTPEQARRRWALREAVRGTMPFGGAHWSKDWRAEGLRTRRDPGVFFWKPGEPLVPFESPSPIGAPLRRTGKALLTGCGAQPLLDRLLPGYRPADLRDEPPEVAARYLELMEAGEA